MWTLDPDDTRPPYIQVAEAVRHDIRDGSLKPGAKLPSHQAMADDYGVSVGTVKRALGELQGAGLVVSRQGQGAFVRTRPVDRRGTSRNDLAELRRTVKDLTARVESVERQVAKIQAG